MAGIPVVVVGDAALFERDDVRQLVNLFTFLGATRPWGDIHVRQPILGLDEVTVTALGAFPGYLLDVDDEKWQEIGITSPADRRKLSALLALKRRVQAKEHTSLLEVFYELLALTGYAALCERARYLDALLNLGVFSQLVAAFDEHGETRTLYPFLDYLQLMRDGGVDPAVVEPEDAVRVMTIHQAKGLEFPVVVVGSVMKGTAAVHPATRPLRGATRTARQRSTGSRGPAPGGRTQVVLRRRHARPRLAGPGDGRRGEQARWRPQPISVRDAGGGPAGGGRSQPGARDGD